MQKEEFDALVKKLQEEASATIKAEVKSAIDALKLSDNYADQEKVQTLETELAKANQLATEAKENSNQAIESAKNVSQGIKSLKQLVREGLEASKEKLISLKENGEGFVDIMIKAPAETTTGNTTLPAALPAQLPGQDMQSVTPQTQVIPFVFNYVDDGSTDRASIPYADEVGFEGDAAFLDEGAVKPLIDVDVEIRTSNAKKVAGKVKTSEENLMDFPFMEGLILGKLRRRHDIALQASLLNGAGGVELDGIIPAAAGFAAGGLAASIESATNYDAIAAAYNQIIVTSDGEYMPNAVFAHPTDVMLMRLSKDANNNYIMPPFAGSNGDNVMGLIVVPSTAITLGSFLVGDFSKAVLRRYMNFGIRVGYGTNASGESDFERNMVTILGESRVHFYISENEKAAFVSDTFATAKTALETA